MMATSDSDLYVDSMRDPCSPGSYLSDFDASSEVDEMDVDPAPTLPPHIAHAVASDTIDLVCQFLQAMKTRGLTVDTFLHTITSVGGLESSETQKVPLKDAQLRIIQSEHLTEILTCLCLPDKHNPEPEIVRSMNVVGRQWIRFALDAEQMETLRDKTTFNPFVPPKEDHDIFAQCQKTLQSVTHADWIQRHLPLLWTCLEAAATNRRQNNTLTSERKHMTLVNIAAMLIRSRWGTWDEMAKLWSLYLKGSGLSARALESLSRMGLTMSHSWTCKAFGTLSSHAMEKLQTAIQDRLFILIHDNVNLPVRTFSQRVTKNDLFISGTAGTVLVFPKTVKLPDNIYPEYQKTRREGEKKPFAYLPVMLRDESALDSMDRRDRHAILRVILNSKFAGSYDSRALLAELIDWQSPSRLPFDGTDRAEQHMLRTAEIEEASYEGNVRVKQEWLKQLRKLTDEGRLELGTKTLVPWIGDQLTAARLRGLSHFRHDDDTAFERLDWMVVLFGWFHLLMALGNSIYDQFYGTARGTGLKRAIEVLNRKWMSSKGTKGTFWHHIDELYHHMFEADILTLFLKVGELKTIDELLTKTPPQLEVLAEKIRAQFASGLRVEELRTLPEGDQDKVLLSSVMFLRDVLVYIQLREAMRTGDVETMEALIPDLLARFAGGNNPNYARELLELLQCLHREWPSSLKDFVRRHCWLFNFSGKPNAWQAGDMVQEHNIKDIKVTYRAFGPGATFRHLQKMSPIIPGLRHVRKTFEQTTFANRRGSKHRVPEKDKDIALLMKTYQSIKRWEYQAGRKAATESDGVVDLFSQGVHEAKVAVKSWWNGRNFPRKP
ncbi:hypothetical protein SISSUDRAFT_1061057 [Sistotremastrum suecicum HHB10207 ss-3]|uniref:DUF6589 domain-containing protein n=1 Tax=Sistotremastrum suecicum HHB10207 ss-3 TaxID=1314776 RepID=A0A166EH08_9AGAM|nr:hypothetical protein SISSUDRAFT_1061057 [Sistotremastrum suecicum HHB10207 ss-3]